MVNPLTFGSTSGISFSGIATGLDTSAIIQALVALETAAIRDPIVRKKSDAESELSALQSFETKLNSLKSAAENIDTQSEFLAYLATSSDTSLLTATSDGTALDATHDITVAAIASNETEQLKPEDGGTDTWDDITTAGLLGTGDFILTYAGTATTISIGSGDDSINGFASAINSADVGVTATVLNTADENDATPQYSIILTGEDTGASKTIEYDFSGLSGGTERIDGTNSNELTGAADTSLTVDGVSGILRETTTINDVIPGVTLNIVDADTDTNVKLTVAKDVDTVKSSINSFVNAYNDVVNFIGSQQNYTEGESTSPLFGELALTLARSALPSKILDPQFTANADFENLAQIGVSLQSDGTLEVDDETLEDALEDDMKAVGELFYDNTGTDGAAKQIKDFLDDFVSSADGVVKAAIDSRNDLIEDYEDQLVIADQRLTDLTDDLTRKYAALEALVGDLQSQLSYIGAGGF